MSFRSIPFIKSPEVHDPMTLLDIEAIGCTASKRKFEETPPIWELGEKIKKSKANSNKYKREGALNPCAE